MNLYKIFKHSITALTIISLAFAVKTFYAVNFQTFDFVDGLIFGTYASFLFLTLLTFRLSLIHTEQLKKTPLAFFGIVTILVSVMYFFPESVLEVWKLALSFFIIQLTQVFLSKTESKGKITLVLKLFLITTAILLILSVVFEFENRLYFRIIEGFAIVSSLLSLVHIFLTEKATNS